LLDIRTDHDRIVQCNQNMKAASSAFKIAPG
jgi:hypothetical protein